MGMLLGIAYVVSGLLITMAGRRNWKLRRGQRAHRDVKIDPQIGSSAETAEAEADDQAGPGSGNPHA
jgi:hypothetical protein